MGKDSEKDTELEPEEEPRYDPSETFLTIESLEKAKEEEKKKKSQ